MQSHSHHHHDHHHHHHHDVKHMSTSKLLWVSLLNFSITLVQIVGGIFSNSLSLLSDAIHNLGDSSAIFIAFLAGKKGEKKADKKHTFGHKRIEILAALFNAIVLVAICLFLLYEAYQRWKNPEPIKGKMMIIVAIFGLLANLISVLVLQKDKNHNLNVKAAYLHLLGDTLSSVAVILGGIAIWQWNLLWLDPLITAAVSLYIIYHTWGVLTQTVDILMQAVPENIDLLEIKKQVEAHSEIDNIHHLHVWKLDDNQIHLETHINLSNNVDMVKMMQIRDEIENLLYHRFDIQHITLEIGYDCCKGDKSLIV